MILLTGGAGFIGSCFLKKLNDEGIDNIIVADHLGTGDKWKNLVGKRFWRFFHKNDLRQRIREDSLGDEIETIFHLGACSVTTERDADYMLDNNFAYSTELAEYAEKNGIRFIYASSAATYGLGEYGWSDNKFRELKPMNIYGFSKHLFDLWVLDRGYEDKFTGLKYFNVFGPNEYHKGEMASMVYKSYKQIEALGKVRLFKSDDPRFEDGGQKRDFIYVKDVIEVMWNLYLSPDVAGIFNLGTGKANTWNDLVNAVFDAAGKKPDIEYVDMPESLKGQYQNFTEADMNKLEKTGCSIEFRDIRDSINDYVKNYLASGWKYF